MIVEVAGLRGGGFGGLAVAEEIECQDTVTGGKVFDL